MRNSVYEYPNFVVKVFGSYNDYCHELQVLEDCSKIFPPVIVSSELHQCILLRNCGTNAKKYLACHPDHATTVLKKVAECLLKLHEEKHVHLDIKAENIAVEVLCGNILVTCK